MRKLKLVCVLLFFCFQLNLSGQVIPSSCEADSTTVTLYNDQAARLSIRWLRATKSPDTALIIIPEVHQNYVRDALIAVYNAEELSGYDSIRFCYTRVPDLNHFVILCDTNTIWADAWSSGELLTGDYNMDSLLSFLDFEFIEYIYDSQYDGAFVEFYTDKIFNVNAVCNKFLSFSGINMAYTYDVYSSPESSKLNYNIENDVRKLTYSFGWGDCLVGCTYWKHWNINIYDDCSVELVGHNPPIYTGTNTIDNISYFSIYPNPFTTSATFEYTLQQPCTVQINVFNNLGEQVAEIRQNQSSGIQQITWNAKGLPPGVYFYRMQAGEQFASGKVIINK